MKIVVSFSITMYHLRCGNLTLEEIANADTEFFFSCSKHHVLTEGLVPYEATWRNKELPSVHHIKNVDIAHVDPNHQQLVLDLLAILDKADKEGRVHWKIGSQPDFIRSLPADTRVHYEYGWNNASSYQ